MPCDGFDERDWSSESTFWLGCGGVGKEVDAGSFGGGGEGERTSVGEGGLLRRWRRGRRRSRGGVGVEDEGRNLRVGNS